MIENTTNPRARAAIARAHEERSKIWTELWDFITRK